MALPWLPPSLGPSCGTIVVRLHAVTQHKGDAELLLTRFNQGEAYRTRKEAGLARLKGARCGSLDLEQVLQSNLCSHISADAGGTASWPQFAAQTSVGFLAHLRHNKIIGDLLKRPEVALSLQGCASPDDQVWVLLDSSRRTVESQLANIIGATPYVGLGVRQPARSAGISLLPRLRQYLWLHWRCSQRFNSSPFSRNHSLAMEAIWASNLADQMRGLLSSHRPRALFAYRDFVGTANTLVQVVQAYGIPTYSTQHSILPEFTGRNYRVGNVDFENSRSENFVCWGEFTRRQFKESLAKMKQQRRLMVFRRPTSAEEKQLSNDKCSQEKISPKELLVSLMGTRHEGENAALLQTVFKFAGGKQYQVTVRPHPSLSEDKYRRYIDFLKSKFPVQAQVTDAKSTTQSRYSVHSLGITGLTSTYYENLFFGIPVIFVDGRLDLVEPLPRVLPGVTSVEELKAQVEQVGSLTWSEWYQMADPVCRSVYGADCLDFDAPQSMLDFVRADAEAALSGGSAS